ncbi:hypothetical protein [Nocardia terpenica]|uniref:hypothetical protein n=1 Tax=Nocardia terpenica TaxID=455432 RepID=UPI0012E6F6FF|nr:hypothetical protein [Nocardia terpenica]
MQHNIVCHTDSLAISSSDDVAKTRVDRLADRGTGGVVVDVATGDIPDVGVLGGDAQGRGRGGRRS